uniref:Olfactory receptor class A related 5 n=1 Tax=Cyclopterus lumpus TaxID=8103 RepID=A0A8C2ZIF6_CYCLU
SKSTYVYEGPVITSSQMLQSQLMQKSGIRTNEVLFINLAVSNLITNCLVDLPDTVADFAGRWFLGETFCAVFRFCADLSETSSIYSTFFISAFWYQKLVGSLKRGGAPVQMDSLCLVGCLLAGSWTVAVVFSIPHFFFVAVEGGNESKEDCVDFFPNELAKQTYEIFYLTLANALPLAGIVFASVRIVITLLQNRQRIHGHNSDPIKEMVKDENKSTESNKLDVSTMITLEQKLLMTNELVDGKKMFLKFSNERIVFQVKVPNIPKLIIFRCEVKLTFWGLDC